MDGKSEGNGDGSPPRQYVLHALRRNDSELTLDRLVDELLAWEQNVYGNEPTSARRVELRRWLLETYLPQLERNDIVEYDETEEVVEVV